MQRILDLQRAAGNAAVGQLMAGRGPDALLVAVQRCGGTVHAGCPCADVDGQSSHGVRLPVQRAKIPYGELAWSDFKGKKPPVYPAATTSGFHELPKKLKPSEETEDTGTACGKGKTEFHATFKADEKTFEGITSYMWQEKSGADSDYKDGLIKRTAGDVKKCEKDHEKQNKEIIAEVTPPCTEQVADCKSAFAGGETSFTLPDDDKVVITKAKDCTKAKVAEPCKVAKAANADRGAYEWEVTNEDAVEKCDGVTSTSLGKVKAATKADCSGTFKEGIDKINKAESKRLLAHEQGHFDVSEKAAQALRTELVTLGEPLVVDVTACGEKKAKADAMKAFEALDISTLRTSWSDADTAQDAKQVEYDDTTCHGLNVEAQEAWSP